MLIGYDDVRARLGARRVKVVMFTTRLKDKLLIIVLKMVNFYWRFLL